jgi:branched-chain amino acid transport system ATP-binding protein
MTDLVLDAQQIRVEFGGLVAVNDVDFTIPVGSIVALIGPNGAGKTTFFNVLTGLYKPTAGTVMFDGNPVSGRAPHEIAAMGMARTFQNIRLFGTMTATENVMVAMHPHLKAGGLWQTIFGTPRQRREEHEAEDTAHELIEFCGVRGDPDDFAKNLSYGDQRRLEVARALALRPKLLLLDEPTAGMNPQESDDFIEFVRKVRDEKQLTVLLIEHDMKVVMGVSERITVLEYGSKIAEGTGEQIRTDERVIEAYLGKAATEGASL